MYTALKHLHSGWRYVVLLLVVLAIIGAFSGWFGKKKYTNGNRRLNLLTLISAHIQLLVGLLLYSVSPLVKPGTMGEAMKEPVTRYWTVEHAVMMLIALILITVGHSRSKRLTDAVAKHKTIAVFYTIAVIVILIALNNPSKGITIFGSTV